MSKQTQAAADDDQAPELELEAQQIDDQPAEDDGGVSAAKDWLEHAGSDEEEGAADESDDDEEEDGDESEDEADPAAKGQGEASEDDADEDLAAMPEDVRERTRQRIEKLTTGYQQVQQELESVNTDHRTLIGAITETGMDSQQFGQVLEFASLMNSTDPRDLQAAREMLTGQLREINVRLGDEDSLLEGHPDLVDAVENLDITRQHAVELAKARTQQARGQQQSRQAPQQQRQAPQQQQPVQTDVTQDMVVRLNQLGKSWEQSDLAFQQKWPVLMGRLEAIYARTRPEALEQAVTEEWQRIGQEMGAKSTTRRKNRQRPLTNGGTGGAQGAVDIKDPVAGARAWLGKRLG